MATGLGSIMNIGKSALFGSQAALQVVGQNISNVHTDGYSRQEVRFEAYPSLDYFPGQLGQGVNAAEVTRHFDKFVERQFLNKNGDATRWTTMYSNMSSVEGIFNESAGYGIGTLMSGFFQGWEKISQFPDDMSMRQALLSSTQTLTETIQSARTSLQQSVDRAESMVAEQVDRANTLMKAIAELNIQINTHYVAGKNNPNGLLDERDQLVRELGTLIDVDVIDKGAGNYTVNTRGGHTLVDGGVPFSLAYDGPKSFYTREYGSTFDGGVQFNGEDGYEYTMEIVTGGTVGGGAQFRVSLDGGKTWVTDDSGQVMIFDVEDATKPIKVKDLEIHFDAGSGNPLIAGDRFTVVPKNALYWVEPTMGPQLITPQQFANGSDNHQRATGGSIAGNLLFVDYQAGQIKDELDEFAKNLIWEVNRVHTQGAGLQHFNSVQGDYRVRDVTYPLNSPYIGMPWGDRLQAGSFSLALYNTRTGDPIMIEPGMKSAIDINFTPGMSLQQLVDEINNTSITWVDEFGTQRTDNISHFLNVSITDNRLSIRSQSADYEFGFGDDTTGLLAALGINTFFKGDSAANIEVTNTVAQNLNFLNAGRINGGAEANSGDNVTAREISELVEKALTFVDWTGKSTKQTLSGYYASIVSSVGSKTLNSQFQASSKTAQAAALSDTQDSIAGVNLDEEMTSLIKFQASYKAAAKLITTADEMFQTVLGMKN